MLEKLKKKSITLRYLRSNKIPDVEHKLNFRFVLLDDAKEMLEQEINWLVKECQKYQRYCVENGVKEDRKEEKISEMRGWIKKTKKLLNAIKFNIEHPSKNRDIVGGLELGLIDDLLRKSKAEKH